jgi:hypothetical protein
MNINDLFCHLKSLKDSPEFKLTKISYGDEYYSESGEDFQFIISEKCYNVGYSYITEDADDWAQAECYQVNWCDCDGENINPNLVFEIIENWKLIEREDKLNKILK